MTSRYVITWHVTSTGGSVTQFASQSRQQSFANNVVSITCNEPHHKWGVTKTSGLSNAMGTERSVGRDSDTVTYIVMMVWLKKSSVSAFQNFL